MAEGIEANVKGLAELSDGADALGESITSVAEHEVFPSMANRLADVIAGRVPVISGGMASSVGVVEAEHGAGVTMGGMGALYAGWVDFGGTRGRPYYPEGRYFLPAVMDADEQIATAADEAAKKGIEDTAWPTPS